MNIKYTRTRGGVLPTRANQTDAGLDLPFNPEDSNTVVIDPGQSLVLQTGLRFAIPEGYMLEIKNRSGNASKRSLIVGACVVDPGYDGEVFVNLHNIGTQTQQIEAGSKIAQAVLIPVVHFSLEEIEESFLSAMNKQTSLRGDGALGSTDSKGTTKDVDPFETVASFTAPFHCPSKW